MRHRQGLGIGTLALGLLLGLGCAPLQVAPAVSPLGPAVLRVEPAQATLTTGQTTRFQARAQDGSRPTVAWEAVGGGTVDSSGQYAAPSTPGGYLLRARAFGDRVAEAKVQVVAPPHGPITAPDPVVAGTRGLRASVPEQPGSTYAWTLEGGTLDGDSHRAAVTFNAGTGTLAKLACRVVNAAGLGLTTSLELPLTARPTLAITPRAAVLTAGSSRKFGFSLEGGTTGEVVWSVLEPGGGTVDGSGRYQAPAAPGSYTVQVAAREDRSVQDSLQVKVVAAPQGPIKGPGRITAGARGLRASVPDQPGCAYAWTLSGGSITDGAGGQMLFFDAGAGPLLRLTCEITNEAGDSFKASLDVPVAAAP